MVITFVHAAHVFFAHVKFSRAEGWRMPGLKMPVPWLQQDFCWRLLSFGIASLVSMCVNNYLRDGLICGLDGRDTGPLWCEGSAPNRGVGPCATKLQRNSEIQTRKVLQPAVNYAWPHFSCPRSSAYLQDESSWELRWCAQTIVKITKQLTRQLNRSSKFCTDWVHLNNFCTHWCWWYVTDVIINM